MLTTLKSIAISIFGLFQRTGIAILLLALISLYTFFKSIVANVAFINALDVVLSNIINELWKFISTPTIFLGVLAFILIWKFRTSIESVFPSLKEIKAGSFSALFEIPFDQEKNQPDTTDSRAVATRTTKKIDKDDTRITDNVISIFGRKTSQLLLDMDGKLLTTDEILQKLNDKNLVGKYLSTENKTERLLFYRGVYRTLESFVFPPLFNFKVSEDRNTAFFSLKDGVREKLENKIKLLDQELDKSVETTKALKSSETN